MPHISDPDAPPSRAARRRVANDVPQSPEVAEQNLAVTIGRAVAAALEGVLWRPACVVCCREGKDAEQDHRVAVANALAAAEPEPEAPEVHVSPALTEGPDGPVCWAHFEPGE